MTRLEHLTTLRDAVRDGDKWPRVADLVVAAWPHPAYYPHMENFRQVVLFRSVDAALALFAALLPGWEYLISPSNAKVFPYNDTADVAGQYGMADNPARALLLATLEALIKKETP